MKLDKQTKELIAIGASITANCQPCLQYHVSKARESEIDEQNITEAVEIGKMVRRGGAYKMDKFTSSLISVLPFTAGAPNDDCRCA